MAVTIRPAEPNLAEGERFASYIDMAADGLFAWMLGSKAVGTLAKAYVEPGHDMSYEHAWFADTGGSVAGLVTGYPAATHAESNDTVLLRAAGLRAIRLIGAGLVAARLMRFLNRLPEGDWYVLALAVDPAHRGAGIGSLLLDHAEKTATESGARRMALDVAVNNDGARRLYERRGMTIEATSPSIPFVADTAVHRMTKVL